MAQIVVAGALAAKPRNGGEAWVRLSWVLGLRRLGHDVWLVEDAEDGVSEEGRKFFDEVTARHSLTSRAVLLAPGGPSGAMSRGDFENLARETTLLLNISGNLRDTALLELFDRRAYVDLDPGFTQMWHAEGQLGDQLDRYDRYFTVALNVEGEDCSLPQAGIEWVPTPPPVVLQEWPAVAEPAFDRFTTVATWRNPFGPPESGGRTFSLKHHQLRRFAGLPERASAPFEVALDIHAAEVDEARMLRERGWTLVDPREVAADTDAYRQYVTSSGAEFSVTQGVYAETRSGWISDRTAHYLAAGRPAVVQETGLPEPFRAEHGLLTFENMEGAVSAVQAAFGEYPTHAAAAREYAERTFDSDLVLERVLEKVDG